MKRGNIDFQSVRPAELHSAEHGYSRLKARWAHGQNAYVPFR